MHSGNLNLQEGETQGPKAEGHPYLTAVFEATLG